MKEQIKWKSQKLIYLFSMKENETIVEMITRFTNIVNGLEALGKTYKESEKVMKILRSFPSKWHTKVTAI